MAFILQSIMESHSPFRTRKSLVESSFVESIVETFQPKSNRAINHFIAARIQVLTLAEGLQTLAFIEIDMAVKMAAAQSNISKKTVLRYMRTAKLRGYDPMVSTVIKEEYVTDAPRSSRPPKATPKVEARLLAAGNILS